MRHSEQSPGQAPESIGREITAPAGYYTPLERAIIEVEGRKVLYARGAACVEASCCGVGSWEYVQVLGYLEDEPGISAPGGAIGPESETESASTRVVAEAEKKKIRGLLQQRYPNARVEFR